MIKNAKDVLLNENSGTLPQVSDSLRNWYQQITFIKVVKSIVNYRVVETDTEISFRGVIQQMSDQDLQMKPEGQRAWLWKTVHTDTALELSVDEEITYLGETYRVMRKADYKLHGYFKYELVQGYQE